MKYLVTLTLASIITIGTLLNPAVFALESISNATGDVDYYDQFSNGKIGASQEIQQVMQLYSKISPQEYLDIQQSKTQMEGLYRQIQDVSNEFSSIAARRQTAQDKYDLVRSQISKIIGKTRILKDQIDSKVDRIILYTKKIQQIQENLQQIQEDIQASQKYVAILANVLYQIHNDYYGETDQIDNIKLIVKSKNIAQTLGSEQMVKAITLQMDDLLANIRSKQLDQISYSKLLNEFRLEYKEDIKIYKDSLEILNQQKEQLLEFVKLYREDKIKLDQNAVDIFITKQELRDYIKKIVGQIREQVANKTINTISDQIKQSTSIVDKADEGNFLSWPIYPVAKFNSYYQDPIYKLKYGINNPGIDIATEQFTPIYAPANGIVYKLINNESSSLNWMVIIHKHNYVTVLMPLSKAIVSQGQTIKRGQLIGYAGGEPGTRGAGFLSDSPMLHFEVLKDGTHIDPLSVLDLAVVMDKADLPTQYLVKQRKDKASRPISLYDVDYIAGDKVSTRRQNFLSRYGYGPFGDISIRQDAQYNTNVDIDLGICIGFAESGMGRNLSSPRNIGNVGNNDRGDRRSYNGPVAGARSIYRALMNRMLGKYHTILDLSGYGNKTGPIYASSEYNREKNVVKCLTQIKGYRVPEDFPFRINTKTDDSVAYIDPTQIVKAEDRTAHTFKNMMPR